MTDSDKVAIRLEWCARCGPDTPHPNPVLPVKRFVNPIRDEEGVGVVWTHWATCPVTGDPVLIRVTQG